MLVDAPYTFFRFTKWSRQLLLIASRGGILVTKQVKGLAVAEQGDGLAAML